MLIDTDDLLTPAEAATAAGIDRTHIYNLIRQGEWVEPVAIKGRKLYLRDAVEQWRDAHQRNRRRRPDQA